MKIHEILEDVKSDTETLINEAAKRTIEKKGKKYYVMMNGEKCPGSKQDGYLSLENAIKDKMSMDSKSFNRLPFQRKKEKVEKFMQKWKEENNIKDKGPKKRYGFEVLK